jgi:hypothetical protein
LEVAGELRRRILENWARQGDRVAEDKVEPEGVSPAGGAVKATETRFD